MRFTAIDTSAWEELKKSIEELALCMREEFGTKPEVPDLLHNGDVCRTSASERSNTIETRPCCPLSKSDISAITNVRMWKHSLPSPTAKYNDYGTRNRKQRNTRDEATHLRH